MADVEDPRLIAELSLKNDEDLPAVAALCDALGSEVRLKILRRLQRRPYIFTVSELKKDLKMPASTLLFHLEKMQKANLLSILYKSSAYGAQRFVSRKLHGANLSFYYLEEGRDARLHSETQTVGVGAFTEFTGSVFNFCTEDSHFTSMSDDCYVPERFRAQLAYTPNGQISYRFSNRAAKLHRVKELSFTLEICSQAPYFDNDYLSDITFWINGAEVATYTCPGDFGDHRGLLNPAWWSSANTQYGVLLTLAVDESGVKLNGVPARSCVTLGKLNLQKGNKIEVKFGNKSTARNLGGFNVFGKKFGDYPQDISLTITYETGE